MGFMTELLLFFFFFKVSRMCIMSLSSWDTIISQRAVYFNFNPQDLFSAAFLSGCLRWGRRCRAACWFPCHGFWICWLMPSRLGSLVEVSKVMKLWCLEKMGGGGSQQSFPQRGDAVMWHWWLKPPKSWDWVGCFLCRPPDLFLTWTYICLKKKTKHI